MGSTAPNIAQAAMVASNCVDTEWVVMMLGGCLEYDHNERNDGTFERCRSGKDSSPHLLDLQPWLAD
jgi:hypothetical protein